jgi:hypothetical protein
MFLKKINAMMQHCNKVIHKVAKTQGSHPKLGHQNLGCNKKTRVSQKQKK